MHISQILSHNNYFYKAKTAYLQFSVNLQGINLAMQHLSTHQCLTGLTNKPQKADQNADDSGIL